MRENMAIMVITATHVPMDVDKCAPVPAKENPGEIGARSAKMAAICVRGLSLPERLLPQRLAFVGSRILSRCDGFGASRSQLRKIENDHFDMARERVR